VVRLENGVLILRSGAHIPFGVLLLLSLISGARSTSAQSVLDDSLFAARVEEGLHALYDMKFDQAAGTFREITALVPGHPIGPFLEGLNVWWKIMVDLRSKRFDREFHTAMKRVIDHSDRLLDADANDPDGLFFKGLALSFRGRLYSNRHKYVRSLRASRKAMPYVVGLAETDARSDDYYFGWGVYDYFAEALPEEHGVPGILTRLFPNGDRERGLEELERTFEHGRFLRAEAAYFLTLIYSVYESRPSKALEYATWLRVRYPGNSIFRAMEARMLLRTGRWEQAVAVYTDIEKKWAEGEPGYSDALAEQALYYLARYDMRNGDYEAALDDLKRLEDLATRTRDDTPYKVLGRLRQGMAFDALGFRDFAVMRYKQVTRMKEWSDSRERAKRYLERPYEPSYRYRPRPARHPAASRENSQS
jgi:tetratricopeptide (TPR) repeat protein